MADQDDPAVQPEVPEADPVADVTTEVPAEAESHSETEAVETETKPDSAETDHEEYVVRVDGATAPEIPKGEDWARHRKQVAELEAENARLRATQTPGVVAPDPGPEPVWSDGRDFDYDPSAFTTRWKTWREASDKKAVADAKIAEVNKSWQGYWDGRLSAYRQSKERVMKLIPTYAESEALVRSVLSPIQQDVLIDAADDVAPTVVALAQDPKLLQELASLPSVGALGARIGKLGGKIVMEKKQKTAPPPPRRIQGSGSSESGDKTRDKMVEEAARTGNASKLQKYDRDKRDQANQSRK